VADFFSPDYFAARDRFRSGVLAAGAQLESILLDAKGPHDSDLTIDIGWFGAAEPRRAFVHSCGLRGVEGFAGSAIQLQWLDEGLPALASDSAIVLVHALNPFGMAWLRRANENNVDLAFNFLAADEEYRGAPRFLWNVLRHGFGAIRLATSEGQYENPRGLCYGGKQHEQAARRFQIYISGRLAHAEQIVGIDVHTGPGRFGDDVLVMDGRGGLGGLYRRMFPAAQVYFAEQHFGSCGALRLLRACRDATKVACPTFELLCPSDEQWRSTVLLSGKEVIEQALVRAFGSTSSYGVAAH
jgi:hypothetical protein